jgi:hypothetical protein
MDFALDSSESTSCGRNLLFLLHSFPEDNGQGGIFEQFKNTSQSNAVPGRRGPKVTSFIHQRRRRDIGMFDP